MTIRSFDWGFNAILASNSQIQLLSPCKYLHLKKYSMYTLLTFPSLKIIPKSVTKISEEHLFFFKWRTSRPIIWKCFQKDVFNPMKCVCIYTHTLYARNHTSRVWELAKSWTWTQSPLLNCIKIINSHTKPETYV